MKIVVRTKDVKLNVPVPANLVSFTIRRLPNSLMRELRQNIPEPYKQMVTKENISAICEECIGALKENKGLEVVHVETTKGTYVSITM